MIPKKRKTKVEKLIDSFLNNNLSFKETISASIPQEVRPEIPAGSKIGQPEEDDDALGITSKYKKSLKPN
jgi:hypothetical protein